MVKMLHKCKVHVNIKQSGWGVEISKPAVGANGVQTYTGLQNKPPCNTPYSVVNANLRKWERKHAVSAKGAQTSTVQQAQTPLNLGLLKRIKA